MAKTMTRAGKTKSNWRDKRSRNSNFATPKFHGPCGLMPIPRMLTVLVIMIVLKTAGIIPIAHDPINSCYNCGRFGHFAKDRYTATIKWS
jgi:hypothetical protein